MSRKVAGTAADPTVRFTKLKIGNETYSLVFDFNALAVAEEITGLNLMQAMKSLSNLSIGQTRALLYASLMKAQPKMSVLDAGKLLNLRTLPVVTAALGEAITNSLPDPENENPQEPEPSPAD